MSSANGYYPILNNHILISHILITWTGSFENDEQRKSRIMHNLQVEGASLIKWKEEKHQNLIQNEISVSVHCDENLNKSKNKV